MWKIITRCLASLLLVGIFSGPAHTQELNDLISGPKKERGPPVPQFALASLAVMLVLVVVCMPSRKA